MGSIDKACISGFLCRLCSEMHRIVFHIYGDQGQRLCLVEKINGYLPITISPTDPLPKTICETCLRRVEQHYDLLMRLTRIKEERTIRMVKARIATLPDVSSPETIDEEDSDTEYREYQTIRSLETASTSSAVTANSSHMQESSTSTRSRLSFLNGPDDDIDFSD